MRRTGVMVVGLVLVILGAAALIMGGFTRADERTVLEIGSFEATATVEDRVSIPPIVSGGVLALGVGLLVYGAAKGS